MDTQEQILGEFDELDRECTAVLRQNGWDGQALMHWPSGFDYMRLRTRIANLVRRVCGESSSHCSNLVALSEEKNANDDTGKLLHYYGVLGAARKDFERGLLVDLKALVEAEILDDFIEQAERLAEAGYYPAAASLGGAILEDTLRKICDHRSIEYPSRTSIEILNVALAKAGAYDKLQQKRITHLADLRNKADHGHFDQINRDDVDDMLKWVRRFTTEYLGD
jgi:HEPN domain